MFDRLEREELERIEEENLDAMQQMYDERVKSKVYTFEFGVILDKKMEKEVGFDREAKNECSYFSREEMIKESLKYIANAITEEGDFYIEYYEDEKFLDENDIRDIKNQNYNYASKNNLLREIKIRRLLNGTIQPI